MSSSLQPQPLALAQTAEAVAARARPAQDARSVIDFASELTTADAERIVDGHAAVALGAAARARIAAARARLARCIDERRIVYGLTTGFGPLANRITDPNDIETLQRHLVYHLASGVGAPLSWRAARATVLARLASIARGYSGASDTAVGLLTALLNSPLAPHIPEKGTVGASGDLTPLAHMTLALMGEGAFIDSDGAIVPNAAAFRALGAPPLALEHRDGLALVNGVSAMTGVAFLNAEAADRLITWSEALQVAHAELLGGRLEAWSLAFAEARPHRGQRAAAERLLALAEGSERLDATPAASRRLAIDAKPRRDDEALQDPYSIRCAPQIIGAVRDAARQHRETVEQELNAASDNPIFVEEPPFALHGGNFMGCHVALAADALTNAVVMLTGHAERRIARLCDERKNRGLPAFLHRGPEGLNSGFMGAQVTATALVAEMRARCGAASIHSLSTNGDNQDVVSLGTIAARGCASVLEDASRVLAIEALTIAQGVDIALERAPEHSFAPSTQALHRAVRALAPPLYQDRPLSGEIERVAESIRE